MFLLIWGKREREIRLGAAADFCRVCRTITPFEVLEKRMAAHVWFIPVHRGQYLFTTQICGTCGHESKCIPHRFTGFQRFARGSLESLIDATHPNVRKEFEDRLALAERIALGGEAVAPQERRQLMVEAFGLAEPHFRVGHGHQGRRILTRMLQPLRPTEEEIRACLQLYRGSSSRMGAKLKTEEVMISIYPELETKEPGRFEY